MPRVGTAATDPATGTTNCPCTELPKGTPPVLLSTVIQPAWVELSVTEQLPAWGPLVTVTQLAALRVPPELLN